MATVTTYVDEATLQAAIGGTVTTYVDEATLQAGIDAATNVFKVVDREGHFTLIDAPTLGTLQDVVGKGLHYTVITD